MLPVRSAKLRIPVAVHIGEPRGEAVDAAQRRESGGLRHIHKGVAVVAKEMVAIVRRPPAGDGEIEIAIEVAVPPGGAKAIGRS